MSRKVGVTTGGQGLESPDIFAISGSEILVHLRAVLYPRMGKSYSRFPIAEESEAA